MNYIGKCYRLLEDDEETIMQWPEIKTGFEFQILSTESTGNSSSDATGATKIRCLKTNKVFDVNYPIDEQYNEGESWFWCIIHMADSQLEEIESVNLPKELPVPIGKVKLNHFHGKEVDIAYALSAFAGQEGCDSEEYDTMQAAAEYIRYLESITADKFANAIVDGELDDWAADSFNDESRDETRNTGYCILTGAKKFIKGKQ